MSFDFAIVPVVYNYEKDAIIIKEQLTNAFKLPIQVEIDANYANTMVNRLLSWKKKCYNIVIIDDTYVKNRKVNLRFSDKGSKPKYMDVQEFIDLVSSYEDDNKKKDIMLIPDEVISSINSSINNNVDDNEVIDTRPVVSNNAWCGIM